MGGLSSPLWGPPLERFHAEIKNTCRRRIRASLWFHGIASDGIRLVIHSGESLGSMARTMGTICKSDVTVCSFQLGENWVCRLDCLDWIFLNVAYSICGYIHIYICYHFLVVFYRRHRSIFLESDYKYFKIKLAIINLFLEKNVRENRGRSITRISR